MEKNKNTRSLNPTPTLCLNMIVKNESKIITRLLDSVIAIVDCYCICDTGSTDDTKEVIVEYFKSHNIPGKIVEKPFIDFAVNRNYALQSCKNMSDYVLLLDADMVLEISPQFKKESLSLSDSFHILQGTDEFYYKNMRIVRNTGLYEYMGVTHEYINVPHNHTTKHISRNELFIHDIGDGGSKTDKFERDIALLTQGIVTNPTSERYHFYLANTYFDSGKYAEAIDTYKKRIHMMGWDQEVWYSYYRIGLSYKKLNKMEDAIYYWLEAYNYLPNRVENIYEIVTYYRNACKYSLAYSFYKIAKNILKTVEDKDHYLFLNNDNYTYKLEYELSTMGFYLGIHDMNESYITIFNHCNEWPIISNTFSNMKFYKDILKPVFTLDFTTSSVEMVSNINRKFTSSSSCMIRTTEGYLMNTRLVNYTIDKDGKYHDCDDRIISINKTTTFSPELKCLSTKLFEVKEEERRYMGVEDIKIMNDPDPTKKNNVLFIGTGLHKNENIGIVWGGYDKNKNTLEATEIKCGFNDTSCEKNWVYVNVNKQLHIVYSWHPLKLCKIVGSELECIRNIDMPKIFKYVRGSTCGTEYKNEIWFIVHMVSYENPRHYYHMFVILDDAMKLLRYSAPFKFEGECIEYCLSLIVEDTRVLINYSTWDRTTKLAVYNKEYIDAKVCF